MLPQPSSSSLARLKTEVPLETICHRFIDVRCVQVLFEPSLLTRTHVGNHERLVIDKVAISVEKRNAQTDPLIRSEERRVGKEGREQWEQAQQTGGTERIEETRATRTDRE